MFTAFELISLPIEINFKLALSDGGDTTASGRKSEIDLDFSNLTWWPQKVVPIGAYNGPLQVLVPLVVFDQSKYSRKRRYTNLI
jgi:hypothetical protein